MFDFLTRLFNKSKPPVKIKKMICSKHGELNYFCLACGGVEYPFCGHCLGEFLSENCSKVEIVEKEIKQ